ncbi:glycine betaine ABC transporter substrate-binding protein [Acaryochloris sp. IP29b_bin.137]|uniref:glycine betaine ABC transporter substrate-binding protein n=1 Tax=Acaryochloris sp. IP29b_bin.137 TaxID=2969217 RepID=UPI002604AF60|nr:glycine betaine ABC transporter substrate-binding protein [Acaryochloris sp. IP29b_bin.137]
MVKFSRTFWGRLVSFVAIALVACFTVVACQVGSGDRPTTNVIRVGSKDFTEQFILGELYAQLLEAQGLPVERKFNLGGTPIAQAGLLKGDIDLYPEYTGTALLTILKQPGNGDPQQVFDTVASAYEEDYNLVWLNPAPMNNTQALVVTAKTAKQYQLKTISDLVNQASKLRMIGPPEFEAREDGLPGLKSAYGDFKLKAYIATDSGLRYQALTSDQADVVVGFGTDGEINALNLVVLEDDQGLFPPYQVAPVVRQPVLETYTNIKSALNALAPQLTDDTMRRLNYEVSGNRQEPRTVAQQFLQETGLLSSA